MKKIFSVFITVLTLIFGVNAQTTLRVSPINAGYIEVHPSIEIMDYQMLVNEPDKDRGELILTDTNLVEYHMDLRAVADEGWVFDKWIIIKYTTDSSNDTLIIPDIDYDYDSDEYIHAEGWLDGIPMVDDMWDSGLTKLEVIAIFVRK